MIQLLCALSFLGSAGLWVCLAATRRHFRRGSSSPCSRPMTLIKPVRGLDDAMEASFRSIVDSDPLRSLQVIVALESVDDPAYGVARAFSDAHADRDIAVVVTGPSDARMGKIHNMIEALPRAKHREVIFSDADTRVTPELLADTARAFAEGADAAYAMPYHDVGPGLGGWWMMAAFNHAFCVPVALSARFGELRAFTGAWMGYTKDALALVGGLERFEHAIADDLSLGLAAREADLAQVLLREPVTVSETGTSVREVFVHLTKWASIIFWTWPEAWLLAPLASPSVQACAALGLAHAFSRPLAWPLAALAAASASRAAVGLLQDRGFGVRAPAWRYLSLIFVDLGALAFVPLAFHRTVRWRGKTYRLSLGGRAEVV